MTVRQFLPTRQRLTCYGLICLFFLISVVLRSPVVGTLSDGHHQWLTAHSALIVENWKEDGIGNDKFLAVSIPKSIEHQALSEREVYVSYPPGAQLLILPISKIFAGLSVFTIIHSVNLANHLLIAVIIFNLVIRLQSRGSAPLNHQFGVLASIAYLFLPAPFYWHFMVYFADQAVILPFILCAYLEFRYRDTAKPLYAIALGCSLFVAASIDYLAIPLLILLALMRVVKPVSTTSLSAANIRQIVFQLALPTLLPIAVYFTWVYHNGYLDALITTALFRTGLSWKGTPLSWYGSPYVYSIEGFVKQFVVRHLHIYLPLFIISMAVVVYGLLRERSNRFVVLFVLFGTVTLQVLLLRSHSVIHDFSALKFFAPICIVIFGLIPTLVLERSGEVERLIAPWRKKDARLLRRSTASVLSFTLDQRRLLGLMFSLLVLVAAVHRSIKREFPDRGIEDGEIAHYIRASARFEDVFFGLDGFEIPLYPPQKLSIARRLVPRVDSMAQLENAIEKLPSGANVNLVINGSNSCLDKFPSDLLAKHGQWVVLQVKKGALPSFRGCFAG